MNNKKSAAERRREMKNIGENDSLERPGFTINESGKVLSEDKLAFGKKDFSVEGGSGLLGKIQNLRTKSKATEMVHRSFLHDIREKARLIEENRTKFANLGIEEFSKILKQQIELDEQQRDQQFIISRREERIRFISETYIQIREIKQSNVSEEEKNLQIDCINDEIDQYILKYS